jgi:alpha-1,3-mannosyltransferase
LPFLLWKSQLPWWLQLGLFVVIEWAYNVFPSTVISSLLLQSAHLALLVALWVAKWPLAQGRRSKAYKVE